MSPDRLLLLVTGAVGLLIVFSQFLFERIVYRGHNTYWFEFFAIWLMAIVPWFVVLLLTSK